jgi:3-oxoacyl-(acyl-carrier-protein) synthase
VDATHLSRPDAAGQARAMLSALGDAQVDPREVRHVNAHGTATPIGDQVEARSLAEVFGPRAVAVSASKALHGHLLGAGGAIELVATVLALQRGRVPPNAHLNRSELEEHIDIVRDRPREVAPGAMMSNSFAFGGSNVCLVIQGV